MVQKCRKTSDILREDREKEERARIKKHDEFLKGLDPFDKLFILDQSQSSSNPYDVSPDEWLLVRKNGGYEWKPAGPFVKRIRLDIIFTKQDLHDFLPAALLKLAIGTGRAVTQKWFDGNGEEEMVINNFPVVVTSSGDMRLRGFKREYRLSGLPPGMILLLSEPEEFGRIGWLGYGDGPNFGVSVFKAPWAVQLLTDGFDRRIEV